MNKCIAFLSISVISAFACNEIISKANGRTVPNYVAAAANAQNDKVDPNLKGPKGEVVYTAQKGGKYYMNSNGNKVYLKANKDATRYNDAKAATQQYRQPETPAAPALQKSVTATPVKTENASSDVDINIPLQQKSNVNCFALIIGNQDYSSENGNLSPEMNVPFALNDAQVFKAYCIKTLGIPEDHIRYYENATLGKMKFGINWLKSIAKAGDNNTELLMYYAGHGIPDPVNKTSYLMPVDCSPSDLSTGIMLKDVYAALGSNTSKMTAVFLDACFSGGGRNQGLVAARAVRIAPKEETPQGNLVVFSATSGEETSMAYSDKQHGMFTYFLLKELQETKGQASLKQMADYLKKNVALQSLVVNNKEQNPEVSVSSNMNGTWENLKLK